MKGVKLRWRVLRSFKVRARCTRKLMDLWGRQDIGHEHDGGLQHYVSDWQHARGLRGNHRFTAIMAPIGRVAGHRATALHALLVLGHGGHAIRKLQPQKGDPSQKHE